jgi:hypothetical protein
MESALIQAAAEKGIFVILFVFLLLYQVKSNEKREGNYQSIIQNLAEKFDIIRDIQEDVKCIKDKIECHKAE